MKVKELVSLIEEPFDLMIKDCKTNKSEYAGWLEDISEQELEMEIVSIGTNGLYLEVTN